MVKRMKIVFNAPIDNSDMAAVVEYLVKTYGNEQDNFVADKRK
jgi:hypothetical protein